MACILLPCLPKSNMEIPAAVRRRKNSLIGGQNRTFWQAAVCPIAVLTLLCPARSSLADDTNLEMQIQELQRQNAILEQKLEQQNQSIQSLSERVQDLEATNAAPAPGEYPAPGPTPSSGYNFGNVHLSGEGGVAFFNTGPEGFA